MELKDKVVIVTGAAQGLGRQFALDCAANGMKVALADIDPDATHLESESSFSHTWQVFTQLNIGWQATI